MLAIVFFANAIIAQAPMTAKCRHFAISYARYAATMTIAIDDISGFRQARFAKAVGRILHCRAL